MIEDYIKNDPRAQRAIEQGKRWAQAFNAEMRDLVKASAASDPEMASLAIKLSHQILHMVDPDDEDFCLGAILKRSGGYDDVEQFRQEVIAPDNAIKKESQQQEQAARKISSLWRAFTEGIRDPAEVHAQEAAGSFNNGRAPLTYGAPMTWRAPIFDPVAGLQKLDPDDRSAWGFLGLTPAQRKERGVYFERDLRELAETHKPVPRSMAEAVLIGAQDGARRANTEQPGFWESRNLRLAQRNAAQAMYMARRNQIHGEYPGLAATLELSQPTFREALYEEAGRLGRAVGRIPRPVRVAAGVGAGLAGTLGLRNYIRNSDSERRRQEMAIARGHEAVSVEAPVVGEIDAPIAKASSPSEWLRQRARNLGLEGYK